MEVNNALPLGGNKFLELLGRGVIKSAGWKIKGNLPEYSKLVIAVAPHTSNWDFVIGVATLFALRIKIKFLGKHTLFVPVFKQFLEWLGGIPVNRKASHGLVEQVTLEFNNRDKMILAVAPEGTRSPIYPWKTGFLAIAKNVNVPVVLIGFDYTRKYIIINEPFDITGDVKEHMRDIYQYYGGIQGKFPDKCLTKDRVKE